MSLNKKLLHIFYILTVIATKTIADPSNTLLGFWPLDEGKGKIIYDKSPNKNNGSANATWAWNSNKEKAALELQASKNSYVTIPFKPEFNISEELTIQAWIYPFDKKESMIASKGRIHWACGYYLMQSGAEIEFGACTEKCLPKDTPKAFKVKSNANAIKINDWNHIACTYSVKSDKTILYINGKKVKEAKANGKISHHLYPSTPLRFGVDSYATNYYRFSGFLRNIKIHNEALAENAIKKEYHGKVKYINS
jgi:hypothetical protein